MERITYRPAETADLMGISRAKCYELIASGVLPSIKVGGSIRVPADALRAWVAQQLQDRAEAR